MRARRYGVLLVLVTGCSFEPVAITGDAPTSPDSDLPTGDGSGPDAPPADCFAAWKTPGALALSTPVPLANVSSQAEDRDPFVSSDGRILYFASRRSGSQGSDLYIALRATPGEDFAAPAKAADFNTSDDETRLSMTADGLLAFVASNRPSGEGNTDIWQSTRAVAGAPFVTFDQSQLGDVDDSDFQLDPMISADGLTLYFANRLSPQRIEVSRRASRTDSFPAPQPLIDSGQGDADPSVSPDELVIVFASNRANAGFGGGNLWYATRASKSDPFGTPAPIPNVNTNANDSDPVLSSDGCQLYLAVDGGVAGYDLFVADVVR